VLEKKVKRFFLSILICFVFIMMFFNFCSLEDSNKDPVGDLRLRLRRTTGNLGIAGRKTVDPHQIYFLVPIAFKEQVPMLLIINCLEVINYRFIELETPNVLVVATMEPGYDTTLSWTSWVLVKENSLKGEDIPKVLPFPTKADLPEKVSKWLTSTACVEADHPLVIEKSNLIRGNETNMIEFSNDVANYIKYVPWGLNHIPWGLNHNPWNFDAVYTLKWGNTCTGHAHLAAALMRCNHIPARSLMCIPVGSVMDHHWIIDYYIPKYGWIKMESSHGINFYQSNKTVITMVCYPHHEFPVFCNGIEGLWYGSDLLPSWRLAHRTVSDTILYATEQQVKDIFDKTTELYHNHYKKWGLNYSNGEKEVLDQALAFQKSAKGAFQNKNIDEIIQNIDQALSLYSQIEINDFQILFFDNFEKEEKGWKHGGVNDEWEVGSPSFEDIRAYSGTKCYGMDLDNTYENDSDNWLLSPEIKLDNKLICVFMSFYVLNWVQDFGQCQVGDPLWVEITDDNGVTFNSLCYKMGGVSEDPELPHIAGWNKIHLDLTEYISKTVKIRFRFKSNSVNVQPGSYIDDIKVYGRLK
jgi:hypothetical protein